MNTLGRGTHNTIIVLAVVGIAATALLPSLSGAAAAAPAASNVAVEGFAFKPATLEVKAGTKVVWTNNDDVGHTVTSGTPDQRTGVFNQSLAGKGANFEFTFAKAGTFAYYCMRHNSMRGQVVVKE